MSADRNSAWDPESLRIYPRGNPTANPMPDDQFWELIARIDSRALGQGDEERTVAPLVRALEKKSESELFSFSETLARTLYALDGEIYFKNCGDAASSDDSFLYARCFVVAKGKTHYLNVLKHPEDMTKSISDWCEPLLYVHRNAWAHITGRDVSEWSFETSVSFESGSNSALWPE
jgi:hypothetical protein